MQFDLKAKILKKHMSRLHCPLVTMKPLMTFKYNLWKYFSSCLRCVVTGEIKERKLKNSKWWTYYGKSIVGSEDNFDLVGGGREGGGGWLLLLKPQIRQLRLIISHRGGGGNWTINHHSPIVQRVWRWERESRSTWFKLEAKTHLE